MTVVTGSVTTVPAIRIDLSCRLGHERRVIREACRVSGLTLTEHEIVSRSASVKCHVWRSRSRCGPRCESRQCRDTRHLGEDDERPVSFRNAIQHHVLADAEPAIVRVTIGAIPARPSSGIRAGAEIRMLTVGRKPAGRPASD